MFIINPSGNWLTRLWHWFVIVNVFDESDPKCEVLDCPYNVHGCGR